MSAYPEEEIAEITLSTPFANDLYEQMAEYIANNSRDDTNYHTLQTSHIAPSEYSLLNYLESTAADDHEHIIDIAKVLTKLKKEKRFRKVSDDGLKIALITILSSDLNNIKSNVQKINKWRNSVLEEGANLSFVDKDKNIESMLASLVTYSLTSSRAFKALEALGTSKAIDALIDQTYWPHGDQRRPALEALIRMRPRSGAVAKIVESSGTEDSDPEASGRTSQYSLEIIPELHELFNNISESGVNVPMKALEKVARSTVQSKFQEAAKAIINPEIDVTNSYITDIREALENIDKTELLTKTMKGTSLAEAFDTVIKNAKNQKLATVKKLMKSIDSTLHIPTGP